MKKIFIPTIALLVAIILSSIYFLTSSKVSEQDLYGEWTMVYFEPVPKAIPGISNFTPNRSDSGTTHKYFEDGSYHMKNGNEVWYEGIWKFEDGVLSTLVPDVNGTPENVTDLSENILETTIVKNDNIMAVAYYKKVN